MNALAVVLMSALGLIPLEERLMCESFAEYQQAVSPKLELSRLSSEVYGALEPVRFGRPTYVLINAPPRHGKTTCLNHAIAKMVTQSHWNVGYATYGDVLAEEQSENVKRLVKDTGFRIEKGRDRKDEWLVAHSGSRLRFAGVDSGWTGKGFNWIVFDDPLKGRNEAESGAIRSSVWRAMYSDVRTRLDDWTHGSVTAMQTRWAIDDPAGRILAGAWGFPFDHIKLPALDGNGQALCPTRFPVEVLAKIRSGGTGEISGEYDWWSLYQQEPRPRGSAIFHEPARYDLKAFLNDPENPLHSYRWVWALDPAATAKNYADYSACALLAARGVGDEFHVWVVDVLHLQVEVPELCRRLIRARREWAARGATGPVVVEAVAGFKSVPQMLREQMPSDQVHEAPVRGDKFTRAQGVAGAWNGQRVHVPHEAQWADALISECQMFTGLDDKRDDQVDMLAHGWNKLFVMRPTAPRGVFRVASGLGW